MPYMDRGCLRSPLTHEHCHQGRPFRCGTRPPAAFPSPTCDLPFACRRTRAAPYNSKSQPLTHSQYLCARNRENRWERSWFRRVRCRPVSLCCLAAACGMTLRAATGEPPFLSTVFTYFYTTFRFFLPGRIQDVTVNAAVTTKRQLGVLVLARPWKAGQARRRASHQTSTTVYSHLSGACLQPEAATHGPSHHGTCGAHQARQRQSSSRDGPGAQVEGMPRKDL